MKQKHHQQYRVVTMGDLNDLQKTAELHSNSFWSRSVALDASTGEQFWLTHFTAEAAASANFRASLRKDLPMLQMLQHFNILPITSWGESENGFSYTTKIPEGTALSTLQQSKQYTWDEVTDIGWQLSSAIQLAHNSGVVHGGLSEDCVFLSEEIRVQVADFGIRRWLADCNSEEAVYPSVSPQVDLVGIGKILDLLVSHVIADTETTHTDAIRTLIEQLQSPETSLIARDIQGQLGNMLLSDSGDSIEMVDQREGQGLSRRSLVDELFDENETIHTNSPPRHDSNIGSSLALFLIGSMLLFILLILAIWVFVTYR